MKTSIITLLAIAASHVVHAAAVPVPNCDSAPALPAAPGTSQPHLGGPPKPPVSQPPATGPGHAGPSKPPVAQPSASPGHTGPGKPPPGSLPPPGPIKPHDPPHPPTNGTSPGPVKRCDVAVLGGGVAGSYAAFQLHTQNISVCLIEKRDVLGGAVNTYVVGDGHTVDYGVIHWTPTPEIVEYFGQLGIETKESPYTQLPPIVEFDMTLGIELNVSRNIPDMIEKWSAVVNQYGERFAYSWPEASSFEDEMFLLVPEYLTKHGLEDLASLLRDVIDQPLEQLPMAYILKTLDWYDVNVADLPLTTKDLNNIAVYNRVAELLGTDSVMLNSYATSVRQLDTTSTNTSSSAIEILVTDSTTNTQTTIHASQLITAYLPNTESDLSVFSSFFTPEQTDLLGSFQTTAIHTGLVRYANVPLDKFLMNVPATSTVPGDNNPMPFLAFIIPEKDLNVGLDDAHTFYIVAETPLSEDEVYDVLLEAVSKISPVYSGEMSIEVVPEIIALDVHPKMSPRVTGQEIKAGHYDKLNGLQGENGGWFAGNYIGGWKTAEIMKHVKTEVLPGVVQALKK